MSTPTNGDLTKYAAVAQEFDCTLEEAYALEQRALAKFKRRLATLGITPHNFTAYMQSHETEVEHSTTIPLFLGEIDELPDDAS